MQLPLQLQADSRESLQAQLFGQFVRQIGDGRLKPGMRIPATRQLAVDLGISRNTVLLAYERLLAEGYVQMRGPHGTFVVEHGGAVPGPPRAPGQGAAAGERAPAPPRPPVHFKGRMHHLRSPNAGEVEFDFWVGRPDPRLFPARAWRVLIERSMQQLRQGDGSYGEPSGLRRLREAVARHVGAARGIACGCDDVLITNGIQEGLNIVGRLLVGPGTAVGMESPGYLGAANVFSSFGAELLPCRVDAEGAAPDDLRSDCRLMYLTPAHQYPSGVAMSARRRQAWLQWARDRGGCLIEDDYDSDFYYDGPPLPALKAGDRDGCVIYLGTFSKSLSAGLRVGYLIVPRQLRIAAITVKGLMTNGSPGLVQGALAEYLERGDYAHHLRRLRKQYAQRRDALGAALARCIGGGAAAGAQAGMHVLWQAPDGLPPAPELEHLARAQGVGVYGLESANVWLHDARQPEHCRRCLLLGYAALDCSQIATGIERLAAAVGRA